MIIDYSSEDRILQLKNRTIHCVCKYCGSKLHVRRIIFSSAEGARVEIFCEKCGRIEFGVEKEIFQCAKTFVERFKFNLYPELDDGAMVKRMTIAKVCDIITWADQKRGFLDEQGFRVPINMDERIDGVLHFVRDVRKEENQSD